MYKEPAQYQCVDPEGGVGVGVRSIRHPPPTPGKHIALGFISNNGRIPLENHKATKPACWAMYFIE